MLLEMFVTLGLLVASEAEHGQCGKSGHEGHHNFIVGGHDAQLNQYPWQVKLWLKGRGVCGGSIISENKILTAAHCTSWFRLSQIIVTVGGHNLNKTEVHQKSYLVCGKEEHPDYHDRDLDNDIAILTLCGKLTFSEGVRPVCLPDPTEDYANIPVEVTGWGDTRKGPNGSSQLATILQAVTLKTQSHEECKQKYKEYFKETMICAAAEGKDSCNGDSGGPMVVKEEDDKYHLIGIVSFGPKKCANPKYPGVYTRVTSYLDWIQTNL